MIGKTNASSGGGFSSNKPLVIVEAPIETINVKAISASETKNAKKIKNNQWIFNNLTEGIWTITITNGTDTSSLENKNIENKFYFFSISYRKIPLYTYSAGLENAVLVDDNDVEIKNIAYEGNWKIRFLKSGTFKLLDSGIYDNKVDIFLVGGGGNGAHIDGRPSGGSGGFTKTERNISLVINKEYPIEIGAGGNPGGTSSFGEYSIPGGQAGGNGTRPKGGSGGGGYTGAGGYDGADGVSTAHGSGGYGQKGMPEYGYGTREFNEPEGTLYSGGGGGSSGVPENTSPGGKGGGGDGNIKTPKDGAENTGGGGGGSFGSVSPR